MKIIKGGITAPIGFMANGINCGIKREKPDLALIYSTVSAKAYALFTANKVQAAPVKISKSHIRNNSAQAVIVNSGNANCFTGDMGIEYAKKTTELLAKNLGIDKNEVLVASTGIIGKPLPFGKIKNSIARLVVGLDKKNSREAAKAIMTTDTFLKEIAVEFDVKGRKVKIGAMAKGAGMIYPDLRFPNHATMLVFINTDANIDAAALKDALNNATTNSFNCISVDGCQSTNDSLFILANGLALNRTIKVKDKSFLKFKQALSYVCLVLARAIVKDAEGAEKFITINISGARSVDDAKKAAFSIANSMLFKTAMHGEDPNIGRIVAAVGATSLDIKEDDISIKYSNLKKKDINISVDLNTGKYAATVYTCDLSKKYVDINSRYN